jgi:hypothetical protein
MNGYGISVERMDHRSTGILKSCQEISQRVGKFPQATFSVLAMSKMPMLNFGLVIRKQKTGLNSKNSPEFCPLISIFQLSEQYLDCTFNVLVLRKRHGFSWNRQLNPAIFVVTVLVAFAYGLTMGQLEIMAIVLGSSLLASLCAALATGASIGTFRDLQIVLGMHVAYGVGVVNELWALTFQRNVASVPAQRNPI